VHETVPRSIARLLRQAAWAPITVVVGHEVAARIFGHEPVVDPIMHFSGGMAAAYFVRRACAVCPRLVGAPTPFVVDLLAFGIACSAALFWEFGEQLSDICLGSHIQTSVTNTLRDLELGVAGAATLLVVRRLLTAGSSRRPRPA
jgi:hypothetical protein